MTLTPEESARSPWITVWFSPRETIDHLVAARPTYFVRVLLIFGAAASLYNEIVLTGDASALLNWRLALGFVLSSAALGIISFYVGAWFLNGFGRLLGGQASVMETRAACAWSAPPLILGSVIILALGIVANKTGIPPGVFELLVFVFSLWSIVSFLRMLGRVQDFGFWRAVSTGLLNLLLAGVIAVLIRSFLFQPFNIPSGSMRPTLLVGDYIFVSKFAYGYSRFSFPFSPSLISGRIFASEPSRGDVAVFRMTKQNADYVKRVVGLPGDRIQMKQGVLHINDTPVRRDAGRIAAAVDGDACGAAPRPAIKRWRETLPDGASYETINCLESGSLGDTGVFTVPPGQLFVLGDNRDNSTDSRMTAFGYVPLENLIGRVSVIYFSREADDAGAVPQIRNDRIGTAVR